MPLVQADTLHEAADQASGSMLRLDSAEKKVTFSLHFKRVFG